VIDFDDLAARNAPLNAFLTFDREARGGEGPLAGLTIGIKANIAVRGLPWHAGIGAWRDRLAARDAEAVRLLREAGAAIIGVQNLEEAALGAKTDNPAFGATQNPHRAGFSPGGSSGGSAAAVAAGLCDAALGTDTMGSIRIPASHCGIYGFKPASGRVSHDGLVIAEAGFDTIGPLARDLDTLERVARGISAFGDGNSPGQGAVLTGHGVPVHPAIAHVFDAATAVFPGQLTQVSLDHPPGRARYAGFIRVASAMAKSLDGVPVSPHLARLLAYGPARDPAKLLEDNAILERTREQVRGIVAEHGVIVAPAVPNPPFPHAQAEPPAQADFACLANIAGLPAIAFPAGWTDTALPVGLQLIGREGEEAGLFALARQLDDKLRAYRPPT
jgi:aspartyl-tRNA(Asn)/glutamyl-tRNA(Gln) amidotransferase subunit A